MKKKILEKKLILFTLLVKFLVYVEKYLLILLKKVSKSSKLY